VRYVRLLLAVIALVVVSGCSSSHHAPEGKKRVAVIVPTRGHKDFKPGVPQRLPRNRLIFLGHSIGGISLNEPQRTVEKAFGSGKSKSRGVVLYFGGRLLVTYWFHDRLTTRVEGLETRWRGFHTRSGVRVGTNRQDLRALHFPCSDGTCSRAAGRGPDAPGTVIEMRHGKVAQIDVFYG
jgi:hypothetical protein